MPNYMPHNEIELASGSAYIEYASSEQSSTETPISMFDVMRTGDMPNGVTQKKAVARKLLEVDDWLPFAAEAYNISPAMKDMIVIPTTIFLTDIPNSNLAAFPFEEMSAWNSNAGDISYRTWAKKPTHIEHANSDPSKAAGVILDSSMRSVPNFIGNLSRVVLLAAWDRNRYPDLAKTLLAGRSGFSMGAFVSDYSCGVCNASLRAGGCRHVHPKLGPRMLEENGKLVYRIARGVVGFELSSVKNPANKSSWGLPIEPDWTPTKKI